MKRLSGMDRVLSQASSGRWLLTVMAGAALMMLTFTYCKCLMEFPDKPPVVSGEALFAIITMVFVSYFQKKNGNGHPPELEEEGGSDGKES